MRVTVKHLHEHVDILALADESGIDPDQLAKKRLKQHSSRLSQVPETTVIGRPETSLPVHDERPFLLIRVIYKLVQLPY